MNSHLSRDEYRLLVERSPLMIWRADLTMACDYFNEIWLSFTGRTMEQEIGNGWAEGVHPDDLDRCLKIYTEHFAERKAFEMEYRLKRFDGAYRWLFDRGVPYSNEERIFMGFIGSCIDVTDRIEGQMAMKRAQEAEIRQLRGFLPICSYCKRIRNDQNYWEQLESYITDHSEAFFSHSICPECQKSVSSQHDHSSHHHSLDSPFSVEAQ